MGRKKKVVNMAGVEIKTGGSGAKPVPTGDHGGVGQPGNQNAPDLEQIDRVPSDGEAPIPTKQFGWQNPVSKIVTPEPPIVNAGTLPGDASKHDPNFAHRIRK